MITPKGFLNCYELDEWFQLMEDRAYDDIANNDDVELDDDHDLKVQFYPEELWQMKYQITEIEFDFDNSCPYCGGNCHNDHDNACDGFIGDIDELVQQQQQN